MDRTQAENWMLDMIGEEKIFITCKQHMYTPTHTRTPSHPDCKKCWEAYYTFEIAKAPPHKRKEYLDGLEQIVYPLAELEDKGQLGGFELFKYPKVKVTKQ